MKKLALLLMGLTLWVDFCLVLGVIFTGTYGGVKEAATITLPNYSIDSTTPGGASMILFLSFWTATLAALGLWVLGRRHRENQGLSS